MTPWPVAYHASWSMGFSRQEYWGGVPFPLQEIFPTQGLNPGLPHCRQTLYRLSHLHGRDCLFLSCRSCPSLPYSFGTDTGTVTQNQLTPFRLQFPAKSNSYLWHISSKAIRVSLRPTKFSLLLTSVLPE